MVHPGPGLASPSEAQPPMKCAIMQPTYLPWAGYLNLMSQVDVFVFLDDAQYERGSWQNRNRILLGGQPHWLTIPVQRAYLGQSIMDVQVDDKLNWRQKHHRLLSQTYGKHPFVTQMLEDAQLLLSPDLTSLSDLNIALIERLCDRLGVTTKRIRSSSLHIPGKRTDRLIAILEHLGASDYISPVGSRDYLIQDDFAAKTDVRLSYHTFTPGPYPQRGAPEYVSHLSILDVLANLGTQKTIDYVLTGTARTHDRKHP